MSTMRVRILMLAILLAMFPSLTMGFPSNVRGLDLRLAPDLVLRGMDGSTYRLRDFRGRMVAIHFWASWCVPCRHEIPELDRFIRTHPDLVVLPISLDTNPQDAIRFLQAIHARIPLLFAPMRVAFAFGVRAIPATIILDKDQRMVYAVAGEAPWNSPDFAELLAGALPRLP